MPNVSNEDITKFDQAFRGCVQRMGGGKVGIDSTCVRGIVRAQREVAYRYVQIHCLGAASQPGLLQPAMIVATAFVVEFSDHSLVQMVERRAEELGSVEQLRNVGFLPPQTKTAPTAEDAPERAAARAWWRSSDKPDGMCDLCREPLRRGEGFLLDGRLTFVGPATLGERRLKINNGKELLCPDCFLKHRNDQRDPGGRGDNYTRIFR